MSYCRWSTDDFQCDVYVYDHVYGGTTVHVASVHLVMKDLPPKIVWGADNTDEWFARERAVSAMLEHSERIALPPPHAGETYNFDTHKEAAEFLKELAVLGFNVPAYVIETLLNEEDSDTNTA